MLKNEKRWILSCSCSPGKEKYVKALGRNLDVDFDGLSLSEFFCSCNFHLDSLLMAVCTMYHIKEPFDVVIMLLCCMYATILVLFCC